MCGCLVSITAGVVSLFCRNVFGAFIPHEQHATAG